MARAVAPMIRVTAESPALKLANAVRVKNKKYRSCSKSPREADFLIFVLIGVKILKLSSLGGAYMSPLIIAAIAVIAFVALTIAYMYRHRDESTIANVSKDFGERYRKLYPLNSVITLGTVDYQIVRHSREWWFLDPQKGDINVIGKRLTPITSVDRLSEPEETVFHHVMMNTGNDIRALWIRRDDKLSTLTLESFTQTIEALNRYDLVYFYEVRFMVNTDEIYDVLIFPSSKGYEYSKWLDECERIRTLSPLRPKPGDIS